MHLKTVSFVRSTIIILMILVPIFSQVEAEEMLPFSGALKSISKDLRVIVIDNIKISLSSDTKLSDERGTPLRLNELGPEVYVVVEAMENSSGFLAKRIVVKKPKGV